MKIHDNVRRSSAFVLALLVAGCAGEPAEQLFIQPGRFDYMDCPEILRLTQVTAKREQDLRTLIERAEREPVGKVLAVPSYRGDLLKAQGEQKMLAEVLARKQCPPDTQPATAPPPRSTTRRR